MAEAKGLAALSRGRWSGWRIELPSVALDVAAGVALLGVILWRRAPGPRWVFVLALAAMLGALRFNFAQPHFDQTALATYSDQHESVIVNVIAQTLRVPEPQASLLTGILLGDDAGIPKSAQDAFRTTGTPHIVATSG